jgi:hypothetical protein
VLDSEKKFKNGNESCFGELRKHGHHKICRTKCRGNKKARFMISVWAMLFLQFLAVDFHKQSYVSKVEEGTRVPN